MIGTRGLKGGKTFVRGTERRLNGKELGGT